ncbi:unnamed protein product [Closterium sp. NIES-64]|nr:unnamed protein product [Closterium sp. NIES-64]CAI5959955.1 unnamed protein product [Closterium sp. NIES-64]
MCRVRQVALSLLLRFLLRLLQWHLPHSAAPVAPPLPSPAVDAAAPPAATRAPALPSPTLAVTPPLLSPAAGVIAPAAVDGTPALPSPAMTTSAPGAVVVTPPLLSLAAAVTPPLLSPIKAQPVAEKIKEGTSGRTGSQGVTRGESAKSRLRCPPRE